MPNDTIYGPNGSAAAIVDHHQADRILPLLPPSPGPDYMLRQSDAEDMARALKGATTSRSAGMAHQAVEQLTKK